MSDIDTDNNNNVSLQREHPDKETECIPNKAEADNTVPELDLEALHGSLARCNPNDTLKGAKLKWLKTEISDEIVQASTVLLPKHRRVTSGTVWNIYAILMPQRHLWIQRWACRHTLSVVVTVRLRLVIKSIPRGSKKFLSQIMTNFNKPYSAWSTMI